MENFSYWNRQFDFNITYMFHTMCVTGGHLPLVQVGHNSAGVPQEGNGPMEVEGDDDAAPAVTCTLPDFWCAPLSDLPGLVLGSYPGGVDAVVVSAGGSWGNVYNHETPFDDSYMAPVREVLKRHVLEVRVRLLVAGARHVGCRS